MTTTHIYLPHLSRSCFVPWFSSWSRMLYFILVSLVLHILIIAMIPKPGLSTPSGWRTIHQAIYLTLNTAAANEHDTKAPHTAHRPAATHQASKQDPPVSPHAIRNRHPHPLKVQTQRHAPLQPIATSMFHPGTPSRKLRTTNATIAIVSPQPEQGMPKPSPKPAAVAALLRHALQQHFHYPLIALQNSWEGKVVLGVRVTANGEVGTARILKASGFRILDRAAQQAANKIGRLPASAPLLAGQTLTFRVPVAYRLRR